MRPRSSLEARRGHTSPCAGSSLTEELVCSGSSCSGTPVRAVDDFVGSSAVVYRAVSIKSSSAHLNSSRSYDVKLWLMILKMDRLCLLEIRPTIHIHAIL